MNYVNLSKEVSYALRHAPWEYELELDDFGFVPVQQLLDSINIKTDYGRDVILSDLEHVIEISDKKRHEICDGKIRALYGHTTQKKILKEEAIPPYVLYHGTSNSAVSEILKNGLKPMGRQYVHLSCDKETAIRVGKRRDETPAILLIDTAIASEVGCKFYIGNEKVWLTDSVPPCCITVLE